MKTIAEALVAERKKKGVSLENIARKTNINIKALQSMETGDFDHLPGKFYFKHYIRSYLKAIGSDHAEFFKTHKEAVDRIAFSTPESEKVYYFKLKYSRFRQKRFVLGVALLVLILLLAVILIYNYSSEIAGLIDGKSGGAAEQESPAPDPGSAIPGWRMNDDRITVGFEESYRKKNRGG
jgi:cytoskeletal protein RodZ